VAASRDYDVVVPTTGRHRDYLLAALDSIAGQTVPPTRVIVVVDGNAEVARELRERGGVDVILHATNRGEAAARQSGIEAATSTWVAFLDDDDLWLPSKQERLFAYVDEHMECRAVCAGYWMFSASEGASGLFGQVPEVYGEDLAQLEQEVRSAVPRNDLSYLDIKGNSLALLLERNRGVIGTSMVQTALLHSLPAVPEGLAPGADHLLFCHVAGHTEWHLVRERLELYRLHGGQDSRSAGARAALSIVRARRLAWDAYRDQAPPLASYGPSYSTELRQAWWTVLRQTGSPRAALRVYAAGLALLPRWRHRLAAAVPEPDVHRRRRAHRRPGHEQTGRPSW
jgi:glycosyltransferase involved in cell wall biosynthesis